MEENSIFQDIERVINRIEEIRKRFGYKKKIYYPSFKNIYDKAIAKDNNKKATENKRELEISKDKASKSKLNATYSKKDIIKEDVIKEASKRYKIPEELIKAVIKQESNFNEKAVSKKGAMGLMQLMPETAKILNVDNPFDIEENIFGGTKYLRELINLYGGNLNKALAAYNAGPKKVNSSIPEIPETKNFINNVIEYYKKFSKFNGIE